MIVYADMLSCLILKNWEQFKIGHDIRDSRKDGNYKGAGNLSIRQPNLEEVTNPP